MHGPQLAVDQADAVTRPISGCGGGRRRAGCRRGGVGRLRISRAGPAALVLGFARLPEHRLADAVRLLTEAR
jgi:hypothetical protein